MREELPMSRLRRALVPFLLAGVFAFAASACDSASEEDAEDQLEQEVVEDVLD